jgi:restriction system protein
VRKSRSSLWLLYLLIVVGVVMAILLLPGFGELIGIVAILTALGIAVWAAFQRRREARRWSTIGSFYSLNPEEFERHVADTFEYLGYSAMMTPRVGDQGVDIVANKDGDTIAIQCKRYADKAPNSAVSAVHAGSVYYGCTRAMLVCTGGFSRAAIQLAQHTGVELIGGTEYADMVHRVAPTAAGSAIWFPKGRSLGISLLLCALGIAAIVYDVLRGHSNSGYSPHSISGGNGSPLVLLVAVALVVIGVASLRKKKRRRR